MIQINISLPSKDEVEALSDEKFDELWTTFSSSLTVIVEEITEKKEEKAEEAEQDEA